MYVSLSLNSDSTFSKGPQVDLRRAADLVTSSTELTKTTRRNLKSIGIKLKITKGATHTNAEEKSNSFPVIDLARPTIFPNILNLNLQIIDQQNANPRGKDKIFQTNLAKNHKRSCDLKKEISWDWITYPIQKKILKYPKLNLEQQRTF